MNLFLTSNIGGIKKENGIKSATKFFEENQFLLNLKQSLKNTNKFVLIASNPEDIEKNDNYLKLEIEAFNLSGISFKEYLILDNRTKQNISQILKYSSLIFLSGGDTYTQNQFFNEINLKEHLKGLDCVVVGISAGSINCAKDVFNSPEEEQDLIKPMYFEGLGLTDINIEPHFDIKGENELQRKYIIEESFNRTLYGLPDGSYIKDNIIYGECYKIENGKIEHICNDNQTLKLEGDSN